MMYVYADAVRVSGVSDIVISTSTPSIHTRHSHLPHWHGTHWQFETVDLPSIGISNQADIIELASSLYPSPSSSLPFLLSLTVGDPLTDSYFSLFLLDPSSLPPSCPPSLCVFHSHPSSLITPSLVPPLPPVPLFSTPRPLSPHRSPSSSASAAVARRRCGRRASRPSPTSSASTPRCATPSQRVSTATSRYARVWRGGT